MTDLRIAPVLALAALLSTTAIGHAQDPVAAGSAAAAAASSAPSTIWRMMGIPQGLQKIRDVATNRRGNHPALERKPPLKRIADPANLESENPAIKAAAEIKQAEDMKQQKIKAIKYLASIGCGCYDKDGKITEALLAATDDCTPDVRLAAIQAIDEASDCECCRKCGSKSCCNEKITKRLSEIAYERDNSGCPLEPSAEIRQLAKKVLCKCCPGGPPSGPIEEDYPEPMEVEPGAEDDMEPTPLEDEPRRGEAQEEEQPLRGESADSDEEAMGEQSEDLLSEFEEVTATDTADEFNKPYGDIDEDAALQQDSSYNLYHQPRDLQLNQSSMAKPLGAFLNDHRGAANTNQPIERLELLVSDEPVQILRRSPMVVNAEPAKSASEMIAVVPEDLSAKAVVQVSSMSTEDAEPVHTIISMPVPAPLAISAPAPPVISAPAPPVISAPAPPVISAPAPPVISAPAPPAISAPAPPVSSVPALPVTPVSAESVSSASPLPAGLIVGEIVSLNFDRGEVVLVGDQLRQVDLGRPAAIFRRTARGVMKVTEIVMTSTSDDKAIATTTQTDAVRHIQLGDRAVWR
ncbi:hypothetical protein [Novipirellula artificiosorum]|uniref:HEAT repeat protein n=1 Tax=Novipirellula artificiosorum TaxID=2528016 RepID=A0A5C6CAX4_9BACT|nr:hypothetical protein [Novipirellula artificiosorum]TWU21760.1 hypothetical protein Poly41_71510 [Novipirellula artificiosorum]